MSAWSLPRTVRQHLVALRAQVESGVLTPDEAGKKLASHIKEKWPSIYDALAIRWCTARFRKSIPLPEGPSELWPGYLWQKPLSESFAYHKNSCGMTSRWHKRDQRRAAELNLMKAAVNGDLTLTLEYAYERAHPGKAG